MIKKFFIRVCIFLTPVVVFVALTEYGVRQLPSSPAIIGSYLEEHGQDIEVLVLGASQQQAAINPAYMSKTTLNLASGHQDYSDDYDLLSQLHPRLPKLQTVILAMTFAHFDTAPNPDESWKHNTYLYHYGVNAFGRTTYLKDHLLYLSNPSFYTTALQRAYLENERPDINSYGYLDYTTSSAFAKANYDPKTIAAIPLTIEKKSKPKAVKENSKSFWQLLDYCKKNDLQPLIVLTPVTQKHYKARNSNMVNTRDSILRRARRMYPGLKIYDGEIASLDYTLFNNHNHLNAKGAQQFTQQVDAFINKLD